MMSTTAGTCDYDSGSMTDCQPLCHEPATHEITYHNGSSGPFVSRVCTRHVGPTKGAVYPGLDSVTPC